MSFEINKTETEDLREVMFREVMEGLTAERKYLPTKLFYDETGSRIFEQICELDEYYLTRTEMKIMEDNIKEITSVIGGGVLLVEFGSGSSLKTRLLLSNLNNLQGYIPIDISTDHLFSSVKKLQKEYRDIPILPVVGDYTKELKLPETNSSFHRKVAYFPGSTIGNFTPGEARGFLKNISKLVGASGGLLIGIDLKKDTATLERAYNDKQDVTAKFNLNILTRLNRELDADFDVSKFKHFAFYNSEEGRIEMHLLSTSNTIVNVDNATIYMVKGETILTEYSYKYSIEEFKKIAEKIFIVKNVWTDEENKFAVIYLETF